MPDFLHFLNYVACNVGLRVGPHFSPWFYLRFYLSSLDCLFLTFDVFLNAPQQRHVSNVNYAIETNKAGTRGSISTKKQNTNSRPITSREGFPSQGKNVNNDNPESDDDDAGGETGVGAGEYDAHNDETDVYRGVDVAPPSIQSDEFLTPITVTPHPSGILRSTSDARWTKNQNAASQEQLQSRRRSDSRANAEAGLVEDDENKVTNDTPRNRKTPTTTSRRIYSSQSPDYYSEREATIVAHVTQENSSAATNDDDTNNAFDDEGDGREDGNNVFDGDDHDDNGDLEDDIDDDETVLIEFSSRTSKNSARDHQVEEGVSTPDWPKSSEEANYIDAAAALSGAGSLTVEGAAEGAPPDDDGRDDSDLRQDPYQAIDDNKDATINGGSYSEEDGGADASTSLFPPINPPASLPSATSQGDYDFIFDAGGGKDDRGVKGKNVIVLRGNVIIVLVMTDKLLVMTGKLIFVTGKPTVMTGNVIVMRCNVVDMLGNVRDMAGNVVVRSPFITRRFSLRLETTFRGSLGQSWRHPGSDEDSSASVRRLRLHGFQQLRRVLWPTGKPTLLDGDGPIAADESGRTSPHRRRCTQRRLSNRDDDAFSFWRSTFRRV